MRKKFILSFWFVVFGMGLFSIAYGVNSYKTQFNNFYAAKGIVTAGSAIDQCLLCHTTNSGPSGSNVNPYGNAYANGGYNFGAIESVDSDGDGFNNLAEITARTFPGDPNSRPTAADATPPTVSAFTIPATSTTLTVTITSLTATDNVGVTGYRATESATAPLASATGWTATAPTSYTFATAGAKTLYAWAKDAAGNVSLSRSASVTITLPPTADTTAPTVSAFTIPATSTTLTVTITSLTATDNVGVTGYRATESATAPLASATGWTAAAPTSYTFATAGAKTLYAWAKDAAGNVSLSRTASVTITLPPVADTTRPTVSAFTIPATSTTLAVSITSFTATDNVGVTGYRATESATAPAASAAGWSAAAPTSYTFATAGAKTLYAWAKDAAGNVSLSRSASVTITVTTPPSATDTIMPTVSAFTIPATSTTLAVTITSLTATDNVGVTGYMVKDSATAPTASAAGWSAAAPTSYTFTTAGLKVLFAWAKDAAGNVSLSRAALVTITVTTPPSATDTIRPTVSAFTIPATSTALAVSITSLAATDNVGVTGYMVKDSATAPVASAAGWSAAAPTSYTFTTAGIKILYAWAKDAAGNVSLSRAALVRITVATPPPATDTVKPTVLAFTIPATSTTLAVPITSFAATDNVGVTGYMVKDSATAPTASAAGWSTSAPASHTFAAAGAKTLYAWAKDAAGNVSLSRTALVTITASTPPPGPGTSPNMTNWVGKWFKVTEKDDGYYATNSTLTKDNSSVVAYLKIWDWNPTQNVFHVDRYEYDTAKGQWLSSSIDLQYIGGSQQQFLCSYHQMAGTGAQNMIGFTVLIQQGSSDDEEDASNASTFSTLGGYYVESGKDSSGSSVNYIGGLTISGSEVSISTVPVPSSIILR